MWYRTRLAVTVLGILVMAVGRPDALAGQELSELCPSAGDDKAAIIGLVQDADGGMILPGASVIATWSADGEEGRAEVQVGLDGTYTLCGVPQDTEISLRARFTQFASEPIVVSLSGGVGRQDLGVSLTAVAPAEPEDEGLSEEELEAARESSSRAFSSRDIRRDDLDPLPPEMTLYELFRLHTYVQVEPGSDNVFMSGRSSQAIAGQRSNAALVYINERRVPFAVEVFKTLRVSDVSRIELLTPGEGSARYGGDGLNPVIAIRRR